MQGLSPVQIVMNGGKVVSTVDVPTVQVDHVTDLFVGGHLFETRDNTSTKLRHLPSCWRWVPVPAISARPQNVAHTSHQRYIGSCAPTIEPFLAPAAGVGFSYRTRPVPHPTRAMFLEHLLTRRDGP